jgi:hypothetical protein
MALRIEIRKLQHPEECAEFDVFFSNGLTSVRVEHYGHPLDIASFGKELEAFQGGLDASVSYQDGTPESSAWLWLNAYSCSNRGHSAIEIFTGRNGNRSVSSTVRFSAQLEIASVNRLGAELARWAESGGEFFEFDAHGPDQEYER